MHILLWKVKSYISSETDSLLLVSRDVSSASKSTLFMQEYLYPLVKCSLGRGDIVPSENPWKGNQPAKQIPQDKRSLRPARECSDFILPSSFCSLVLKGFLECIRKVIVCHCCSHPQDLLYTQSTAMRPWWHLCPSHVYHRCRYHATLTGQKYTTVTLLSS